MDVKKHITVIHVLKKQIDDLNTQLTNYLKTATNLTLTERWDLYCEIEDSLPLDPYLVHLTTLHKDTVGYDHLVHVENRNSEVYFGYIIEALVDEFEYWFEHKDTNKVHKVIEKMMEDGSELLGIEDYDEYLERMEESFYAQLDAVKTEMLSIGGGGFHYDW